MCVCVCVGSLKVRQVLVAAKLAQSGSAKPWPDFAQGGGRGRAETKFASDRGDWG